MFNNDNWKKYIVILVVIVVSIYALFLRIDSRAHHKLMEDEIFEIDGMSRSLLQLIKTLPEEEINGYLNGDHLLVYPFFKVFSFNKWGLAIPHIIATILGFYLLYLICRSYFKTIWGYLVTFSIVCFNATLIYHATEIRPYAVLPTLALGCLYFSEIFINRDSLSSIRKFFIGAFFLLTICFHTYGIFILFFSLVYALLNKPNARTFSSIFKSISKTLIIVLSIGLPFWLFCVFGPLRIRLNFDVYKYIPNPRINIIGFLKAIFGNLIGFKKLYFLLVALAFPFVFPYKERFKQISFLFLMVFFPILLVYICDIKGQMYFLQRQFIWVMPYFAIFLGWSCDSSINYITTKLSKPSKGAGK